MTLHSDDSWAIGRSVAEPAHFAAIFERHFTTIHRYLARRAGTDVADDLAAEVFTIAFARRSTYDVGRPSALPWLYGIASNVLRADLRRRRRDEHHELDGDDQLASTGEPMEDRVVASLDARRALHALRPRWAALSDDDMTTVLLYAWEELSYEQVAEALEIPVGTVRSRLNRVRRKLREPSPRPATTTARTAPRGPKEDDR